MRFTEKTSKIQGYTGAEHQGMGKIRHAKNKLKTLRQKSIT